MENTFKLDALKKLRDSFNKRREIIIPTYHEESLSSPIEFKVDIGGTKTAYLRSMTFRTHFKDLANKKFKMIFFCIYRIRTEPENEPFLEYLLFKYSKKYGDVMIFPFIRTKGKIDIDKEMSKMMNEKLKQSKLKWAYKGFISDTDNLYLFIKLTREQQYLFSDRLLKRNKEWWWCIIDEMCNQRRVLNFPIHKLVTNIFLKNPILIYVKDTKGVNKPIPRSLYYGQNAAFIPFNFIFGPRHLLGGPYGPYYYLGSYNKSTRHGGWTENYTKVRKGNIEISDEHGKIYKGGIVRYAVFLGKKLKVILNHPNDKKTNQYINPKLNNILSFKAKLEDRSGEWAKDYNSLYYGRAKIPEANNAPWRYYPGYVTKLFKQQIPLTMHILDKSLQTTNWERDNNYYIE